MNLPKTPLKIFTPGETEEFVRNGFVRLRGGFPRDAVNTLVPEIWKLLEQKPDDPSTWKTEGVMLTKFVEHPAVKTLFTQRYFDALDDLCGAGRWQGPLSGTGYMPIRFPGFYSPPWKAPEKGWHVDGIQFHHFVNSREQAIVSLELYTTILPGGGGTAVRPGSHLVVARILRDAAPKGMTCEELGVASNLATNHLPVVELQGEAGDIILMHPHLVHASSGNTGRVVRIAANRCVGFKEPMNLKRENPEEYSHVERAIVQALNE